MFHVEIRIMVVKIFILKKDKLAIVVTGYEDLKVPTPLYHLSKEQPFYHLPLMTPFSPGSPAAKCMWFLPILFRP